VTHMRSPHSGKKLFCARSADNVFMRPVDWPGTCEHARKKALLVVLHICGVSMLTSRHVQKNVYFIAMSYNEKNLCSEISNIFSNSVKIKKIVRACFLSKWRLGGSHSPAKFAAIKYLQTGNQAAEVIKYQCNALVHMARNRGCYFRQAYVHCRLNNQKNWCEHQRMFCDVNILCLTSSLWYLHLQIKFFATLIYY